jgi:LAO/AO transport system kinase
MKNIKNWIEGIRKQDPVKLAQAVTLMESTLDAHQKKAAEFLKHILPYTGKSYRIAVSGAPGSGKSTFIEALGLHVIGQGHKVAVLAVDPSSSLSGGSIMGDKTRMELLSGSKDAFIRPSPSSGIAGGVASKTREVILLCEAAGFDMVLIETLGVGQGELEVRSMVDYFLLLQVTGMGDELQSLKKGILEVCDAIVINKADGSNKEASLLLKNEFELIQHQKAISEKAQKQQVMVVSAIKKEGIDKTWQMIEAFITRAKLDGRFEQNRKMQNKYWMKKMVKDHAEKVIMGNEKIQSALYDLEKKIETEEISPAEAAEKINNMINSMIRMV